MRSQSKENYLKAIFSLQADKNSVVSTNTLAEKMNTKASSVSDMVRKLSEKKLVSYTKYQGVSLTKAGRLIALDIIRKHRLWETFLVETLHFTWSEVHDVAEQLEHIKSDKLIESLDEFLDYPKQDPHGDPIPDSEGNMRIENAFLLSDASINKTYRISGIKDSTASFLGYLDGLKITINSKINTLKKSEFDNSLLIEFNNQSLSLSQKVCDNLYIKNT